jgi:uncharacterized protein (TIGR03066 family)
MKKLIASLIAILSLVACSQRDSTDLLSKLVGSWHLVSAESKAQTPDSYISFKKDNTFALYQQNDEGNYVKYTGTFILVGNQISGKYDNGGTAAIWNASSSISLSSDGKSLSLTSDDDLQEVMSFQKEAIPMSIIAVVVPWDDVNQSN